MNVSDRTALVSHICDIVRTARRPSTASVTNVMSKKDWALWRGLWLSGSRATSEYLAFDEHHIIGRVVKGVFQVKDCKLPSEWTSFTSLNPNPHMAGKRVHRKLDVLGKDGFWQAPLIGHPKTSHRYDLKYLNYVRGQKAGLSFFIELKNQTLSERGKRSLINALASVSQHVIIVV